MTAPPLFRKGGPVRPRSPVRRTRGALAERRKDGAEGQARTPEGSGRAGRIARRRPREAPGGQGNTRVA